MSVKKEVIMYCFSKPVKDPKELEGWLWWFFGKQIYAIIHKNIDGTYELWREGEESDNRNYPDNPMTSPCLLCGSNEHLNYRNPDPDHFRFCSDKCQRSYRDIKSRQHTGISWTELQLMGIAPKED